MNPAPTLPTVTLPFGKHKDKPLPDVPSDYLDWLSRNCKLSSGLRAAVAAELSSRGLEAPTPPPPKPPPPCDRCGDVGFVCRWQVIANSERRIRVECARCRNKIKFAPHVSPFVEMANENER